MELSPIILQAVQVLVLGGVAFGTVKAGQNGMKQDIRDIKIDIRSINSRMGAAEVVAAAMGERITHNEKRLDQQGWESE